MSPRIFTPLAAGLLILLAGCTTTPPSPAQANPPATPTAPQPVSPAPTRPPGPPPAEVRPATIRGSEETSTLLDNFTAYVRAIDGQPISAGRAGWNQPITLPPGSHRLAVEFVRGSFFAQADLLLEAKPGAAYEVRHASDAQVYGEHSYCEFWITDLATGQKVGVGKRVTLEKLKTPS